MITLLITTLITNCLIVGALIGTEHNIDIFLSKYCKRTSLNFGHDLLTPFSGTRGILQAIPSKSRARNLKNFSSVEIFLTRMKLHIPHASNKKCPLP